MKAKNRIVIIDGQNMCRRYEAVTESEGKSKWQPLSLILNHLIWIIERLEPNKVLLAWEGLESRKNRKKIFEGYKSARDDQKKKEKKVDHNIKRAPLAPFVQQHLAPTLPIYQIKENYMEADDIISSLVSRLNEDHSANVIIVSTDHDFYQLLNGNTIIFNPVTKKFITMKDIQEEYGIRNPLNVSWIKAIKGDSSDSIPGCPNCGLKTIQKKLHSILNSEDVWTSEQVKELMKEQKNYVHEDIEKYWQIIQLQNPLNARSSLETRKRLDYIFNNSAKYHEKELMKIYAESGIFKDITRENIQRKLLILSEFVFNNRKSL